MLFVPLSCFTMANTHPYTHLSHHSHNSPNDNAYAHPLDLLPLVDLNLKKVIRIDQYAVPPKVISI